jgi:predicted secreted hydrolase
MQLRAAASVEGDAAALDLRETPLKKPAIHGTGGISRKGACATCASHYYSYTRMDTAGTIIYRGRVLQVTGISWMDHEFGSGQLETDETGWDWFSIQLSDGREVMLYALRRSDGTIVAQSGGSVIERDGSVVHLPAAAFSARAGGTWTSPHTNAVYPSGWRVKVPLAGLDLAVTPLVLDQELADTSGISYWEGAVDVRDAASGAARGSGYVELTGYAGKVSL